MKMCFELNRYGVCCGRKYLIYEYCSVRPVASSIAYHTAPVVFIPRPTALVYYSAPYPSCCEYSQGHATFLRVASLPTTHRCLSVSLQHLTLGPPLADHPTRHPGLCSVCSSVLTTIIIALLI